MLAKDLEIMAEEESGKRWQAGGPVTVIFKLAFSLYFLELHETKVCETDNELIFLLWEK